MKLLDSSALLAALQREPGGERVAAALQTGQTAISAVNLSEVLSVLATRAGISIDESLSTIDQLLIKVIEVSRNIAIQSAELHTRFPKSGLSLGDCICLATGKVKAWTILTADTHWLRFETGVDIEMIR